MPPPVVIRIWPEEGIAGGDELIQIRGSDFRPLPPMPAAPPFPTLQPTVRVAFDGVEATTVHVINEFLLHVVTPPALVPRREAELVVDVSVANLDDDGVPVDGELTVVADAYTYRRPDISHDNPGMVMAVTRRLVELMTGQVTSEVVWMPHSEWDDDTDTFVLPTSTVPALVLMGPTVSPAALQDEDNAPTTTDTTILGGTGIVRRPCPRKDVTFEVLGIDEFAGRLANLMGVTERWAHRAGSIVVEYAGEAFRLEFGPVGDFTMDRTSGPWANSDLKTFTGSVRVQQVPVPDWIDGLQVGGEQLTAPWDGNVDEAVFRAQRLNR